MTLHAILVNLATGVSVRGALTTESAASSHGLAVFLPEHTGPDLDPFGNRVGTVYNRGDLGPNWRLAVSHYDLDLARAQPAWRGIVEEITP